MFSDLVRDSYYNELLNRLAGRICGALFGLSAELLLRRQKPLSLRFSLKELLVATALIALVLGTLAIMWW